MGLKSSSSRPQVDLLVPPGQLAVGEALIKALYFEHPDLSSLSQQQQLQLLHLADSYQVSGVVYAVMKQWVAAGFKGSMLEREVAQEVFSLPGSCTNMAVYRQLLGVADDSLGLDNLDDLEMVWRDAFSDSPPPAAAAAAGIAAGTVAAARRAAAAAADVTTSKAAANLVLLAGVAQLDDGVSLARHELLLGLQYSVFKHLLTVHELSVSSEDTVYYTLTRWLEAHPETTQEQMEELVGLLRLPNCTPNFLSSTVCAASGWIRQHNLIGMDDLLVACTACGSKDDMSIHWGGSGGGGGGGSSPPDYIRRNPAWENGPRGLSDVTSLQLSWDVSVAEIEAGLESSGAAKEVELQQQEKKVWQGRDLALELQITAGDISHVHIGLVYCPSLTGAATSRTYVKGWVGMEKNDGGEQPLMGKVKGNIVEDGDGLWMSKWTKGDVVGWPALLKRLKEKKYVHGDGCLHLRGEVIMLA